MNIINGVYSEDYNQVGGCIMKNILFIASEGVPFIKTGGLAGEGGPRATGGNFSRRTGRCGWITAEGH